jgi:hypothetical protein
LEVHFTDFKTRTFIPVLSLSTMLSEICQGPIKKSLQFRHCRGLEKGKRAASAFDGWVGENISKRPREAMIWPGYFSEARQ